MLRKTVGMNVIEKGDVVECDSVAFQQLTIQTDTAHSTENCQYPVGQNSQELGRKYWAVHLFTCSLAPLIHSLPRL